MISPALYIIMKQDDVIWILWSFHTWYIRVWTLTHYIGSSYLAISQSTLNKLIMSDLCTTFAANYITELRGTGWRGRTDILTHCFYICIYSLYILKYPLLLLITCTGSRNPLWPWCLPCYPGCLYPCLCGSMSRDGHRHWHVRVSML